MSKSIILSTICFLYFLPCTIVGQNTTDLVDENTTFAFNLYGKLTKKNPNKNILFSPFSISAAMAMTYAGARNNTEKQIEEVLQFSSQKELHANFSKLNTQLKNNTDSITLGIANGLWAQKGYTFIPEYFELIKTNYNTPLKNVNFKKKRCRKKAIKNINTWVEEKTDKQILQLIEPSDLTKETRLVLVNAINFYGEWMDSFKKEKTKMQIFKTLESEQKVEFMSQKNDYYYYNDDLISAIQIPYKGNKQSMIIILPLKDNGIIELEKTCDSYYLKNILSDMQKVSVELSIPKFTTESSAELKQTFEKMGMIDAFTKAADFTGMTEKNDLKIDKVIHKAKIEISEKGTKAAAATAVIIIRKTAYIPPTVFNANHPFIYLIRDNNTGTILFMGRLSTIE